MKSVWTAWTTLALLSVAILAGCGGERRIVPVSGRVTLNGGDWPGPGYIDFSPVTAADGAPLVPGAAEFDTTGNFVAKSGPYDGLMPGKYGVAIRCRPQNSAEGYSHRPPPKPDARAAKPDAHADDGVAPARFRSPVTSALELEVPSGSKPMEVTWDIPSK